MKQDLETLKAWYSKMLAIRMLDENINDFLKQGLMQGFSHQCIGQEAVAVGACEALRPDDYITSNHRGHGHCLAKNGNIRYIIAELFGRETGYCRGHGGSMHIADLNLGNLGANGIVGAGVPIAVGAALAMRLKGENRVVLSFFGDGATNQGSVLEGFNLAAAWQLPVVFVCENNSYAISMPYSKAVNISSVAQRAAGFGIPAETIDGNDVQLVYDTVSRAAETARGGGGPVLVECLTYRWRGHSTNDLALYRTTEEVAAWKEKCPIKRLRARLLEAGLSSEELVDLESGVQEEFSAAVKFAMDSPLPDPASVMSYVYAPDVTTGQGR